MTSGGCLVAHLEGKNKRTDQATSQDKKMLGLTRLDKTAQHNMTQHIIGNTTQHQQNTTQGIPGKQNTTPALKNTRTRYERVNITHGNSAQNKTTQHKQANIRQIKATLTQDKQHTKQQQQAMSVIRKWYPYPIRKSANRNFEKNVIRTWYPHPIRKSANFARNFHKKGACHANLPEVFCQTKHMTI
jgi:hypothetical protein